jgi:hypothetical protein
MSDFGSDLGKQAEAGYQAEIDALNAFAEHHPVPAAKGAPKGDFPDRIPPELEERLHELGYTSGEKPPPSPPPK